MQTSKQLLAAALTVLFAATTSACLEPGAAEEQTGTIAPPADGKADGEITIIYRYTEVQGTGEAFAGTSRVSSPRANTLEVTGPMLVLTPGKATGIHAALKDGREANRFLLFTRPVGETAWRKVEVPHGDRTLNLFHGAYIETPARELTVLVDGTHLTSPRVYPWAGAPQAWEYGLFVVPRGWYTAHVEQRSWSLAFACGFGWDC